MYDVLMSREKVTETEVADRQCCALKEPIDTANRKILPNFTREPKRPWVTDQKLNMMDERSLCKAIYVMKYKDLNRKFHRECLRAKTAFMTRRCEETEELKKTCVAN